MASSCSRFLAPSASAFCCSLTCSSLSSNSLTCCSNFWLRLLASASAEEVPFFAPLDASALARAAESSRSNAARLASDSSSFCCNFLSERSVFSAALTCGAICSAASASFPASVANVEHLVLRASRAASRSCDCTAASRPSTGKEAVCPMRVSAASACTPRSRSDSCNCNTLVRKAELRPATPSSAGALSRFLNFFPSLAVLLAEGSPDPTGAEALEEPAGSRLLEVTANAAAATAAAPPPLQAPPAPLPPSPPKPLPAARARRRSRR
mmetsp:Transcript_1003/g.2247  ORF Transcript_1003/g.2247 Transcript_1003/m.2247 type:complete len:268 (-) Transcript_1003:571-1374(-)